jgi:hypothetical protein
MVAFRAGTIISRRPVASALPRSDRETYSTDYRNPLGNPSFFNTLEHF